MIQIVASLFGQQILVSLGWTTFASKYVARDRGVRKLFHQSLSRSKRMTDGLGLLNGLADRDVLMSGEPNGCTGMVLGTDADLGDII